MSTCLRTFLYFVTMFSYIYIFSTFEFIFAAIYIYGLNKKFEKLKKEYNVLDDLYFSSLDDINAVENQMRKLGFENAHKENENNILQQKLKKYINYNGSLRKKLGLSKREAENLCWHENLTSIWNKKN